MNYTRRQALQTSALVTGMGMMISAEAAEANTASVVRRAALAQVKYCLNTSTVRGHKLSVPQQIDLAADAGYNAIELWIGDILRYQDEGGKLSDLRKQLNDRGLIVPSAIGFAKWIVDDPAVREKGLEEARRDMGMLAEIGGLRIAAPPAGATDQPGLSLDAAAERYRDLLDLGRQFGVVPQLELWGFSKNLSRLGALSYVASEAGHADACVLPDVYHIYKGGSDFEGLKLLNPRRIHVFHINDYPAAPPRDTIKDADRVYPGDGIAPLSDIFGTLLEGGFTGAVSLELFNPSYYAQPAETVVREGLAKCRRAMEAAAG